MEFKHVSVLLEESINGLKIKSDGVYVDCTLGGAGHSLEIAKKLSEKGVLIGIDKDETAIEVSKERLKDFPCKKIFVHDDFKNIMSILKAHNIKEVDGILADLGVSSYQIDESFRGFSYSKDGILDMRMDKSQNITAKDILNNYDEKELVKILFDYGEEPFAKIIVKNIVKTREVKPIETTLELVNIIEKSVPVKNLYKGGSVCKRTFQALRIEVNGELDSLRIALNDMLNILKKDGRICVITFHSLEDRIVKDFFKLNSTECICPKNFPICVCNHKAILNLVNKKPIVPTNKELEQNKRSASSKLRIAEKL